MHAVDRYLLIAAALGARTNGPPQFRFKVMDADMAVVRDLFQRKGGALDRPWVALNVSARWPTKRWPLERFGAALDQLYREGCDSVVVIGSADDRPDVDRLRALTKSPFIDLTGAVPLGCLPALLSKAAAMITNDSGPMHVAAAFGVPVVALFGPTSAVRTGPYGGSHCVLAGRVPCSPCFSRICRHDPQMECLHLIKPADVVEATRRLLTAQAVVR
jgi:ADP-heptose:LPS heptosyltransferase